MSKILIIVALTCSVAMATGGEGPEQETAPTVQPIEIIIEEEPTDDWGLIIKYVLPVAVVALIGGYFAKRKKKGGDDDDDEPTVESV